MTPKTTIDEPDPVTLQKLKESGGSFVAPGGKYKGKTVSLNADGQVVVE